MKPLARSVYFSKSILPSLSAFFAVQEARTRTPLAQGWLLFLALAGLSSTHVRHHSVIWGCCPAAKEGRLGISADCWKHHDRSCVPCGEPLPLPSEGTVARAPGARRSRAGADLSFRPRLRDRERPRALRFRTPGAPSQDQLLDADAG